MNRSLARLLAPFAAFTALAASALAHFPFIVPDEGGKTARLVMSETLEPDSEVGIGILAGAKLVVRDAEGKETPLTMREAAEWMDLDVPGSGIRVVHGVADLGVIQRGQQRPHVLVYFPKTIIGDAFDAATVLGDRVPVELVPVRSGSGWKLRLLANGKPVADGNIRIIRPDGSEVDYKVDAEGLSPELKTPGRHGAWARHWVEETGERDGKPYEQVRRYATLVFDVPEGAGHAADGAGASSLVRGEAYTPLPRPIASFGAVAAGDWLYVYGGHAAERHAYSTASVSGRFSRLNLRDPARWEQLPGGVPVQGMNLATDGSKIYRVGGMEPRNGPEAPSDNHSIAEAACFDPSLGHWVTLPPLPRPRSSHDVVVVNGKLHVVGGWWMQGRESKPVWLDTLDVLELSEGGTWESIPQPFGRRALTAAALGEHIFVLGGFDAQESPSASVDIYHTRTRSWSRGPDIPGGGRNGFGPAACVHDGRLYLSVGSGEMYRLRADWTAWEPFATATPRIVHRLVPSGKEVLVIGGAAGARMVDLIEAVPVARPARADAPTMLTNAAPSLRASPSEDLGDAMAEIDEIFRSLKRIERASWAAPADRPGLLPAAEAGRLASLFGILADSDDAKSRPGDFSSLMRESNTRARELGDLLASGEQDGTKLSAQFRLVAASCKDCHARHRD